MVDRRREAFEAGLRNPLMGDVGPLQRLYGTVSAIGSELGGADMGTPFGQRFAESQKGTKAEIKRLQALREKHPEEFGRGMMFAQEQMDPYMLGLGTGAVGGMRPMGTTRFAPAPGESPVQQIAGRGPMEALPAPAPRMLNAPQAAPAAPYYRNVPPEMGTSARPMTPFQQNQVGLSTGRYGVQGYAPEMAVTDFETYGPMGARPTPGAYAPSGFDRNMLAAYRQGRYNRMAGGRPAPMGGDFTLEELGSAPVPYRQGGLVYEPVGGGTASRQIGGPQGAPRLGYERGPIEGQWSEVYGIGGPRAQPYGGGMDFGVTRDGMAASPTGGRYNFGPMAQTAAATAGAIGIDQMAPMRDYLIRQAGRGGEMGTLPAFNPNIPAGAGGPTMGQMYPVMPMGATALSGQAPGAGTAFEAPSAPASQAATPSGEKKATGSKKAGKKGAEQGPPMPVAFEPNLNYYVTQALDRLFGQNEAERGRQYQQYYENQGYY